VGVLVLNEFHGCGAWIDGLGSIQMRKNRKVSSVMG
jgi:hypothetical protein